MTTALAGPRTRAVPTGLISIGRTALRLPGRLVLLLLRGYQRYISPMTPQTCRYYPSCSQYAVIAVQRHGVLRGGRLAAWRLLRCHPWTPGGVDDVPESLPRRRQPALQQHGSRDDRHADCSVPGSMVETVRQNPTTVGRTDLS